MRHKLTWPILLIFMTSLISCKERIDYTVNLNYIFVNNTKYKISFNEGAGVLNVGPQSKSFYTVNSEGPKELKKEDFIISPVQTLCDNCIVFFNDSECDTLKGRGIESISNYEFTKTKQGEYELKYTFNESDYLSSKVCK